MAPEPYLGTYTTYRVTLTNANTEYSQVLNSRAARISVSAEVLTSRLRFSFTSGASGTGRIVFEGAEWVSPGFMRGDKTIYLQSPQAGTVAYIEEWEAP